MKAFFALLATTVFLGGASVYAQSSSTTIETESKTAAPIEKEVRIEHDTEVVPVAVPVEVPAEKTDSSSSSSSSSYSNKSVKKAVPCASRTTTKKISYRPRRNTCAAKTVTHTSQKPAEQVIEKQESYNSTHSENSSSQ